MRNRVVLLLALACWFGIAGCGAREAGGPQRGGVLRLALRDAPPLDPWQEEDPLATPFLHLLYEGLVQFDSAGVGVEPASAERWEVSPDSLTYTFHLARDRQYEDGRPILAADYVRALRAVFSQQPLSPGRARFWALAGASSKRWRRSGSEGDELGVEAPDSHTVVCRLAVADPNFLQHLAYPRYAVPIPTPDTARAEPMLPPASGPYRLVRAERRLYFVRNEHYRGAHPAWLDTVEVQLGSAARSLVTLAARGAVQVVWPEPPGFRQRLQREGAFRLVTGAGEWWHFLLLNGSVAPTNKADVRWAIASGVQREELPAPWEPWTVLQGESGESVPLPAYDPAEVHLALQAVRRQRGLTVPVTVQRDGAGEALLADLTPGWALAGLHAESRALSGTAFREALSRRGGFQAAMWWTRGARGASPPWLEMLLDRALDPRWGDNLPHYFQGGEALDSLLLRAATAPGDDKPAAERALLASLAGALPILPLARRAETAWVRAEIRDLVLHPAYGPLWSHVWREQSPP